MTLGIIRSAKVDGEESATRTLKRLDRTCLSCKTAFDSAWAGERICARCKGTSAWRIGVSTSVTGSGHSQSRSGRRAAS
jgi:hypothetical protein